MIRRTQRIAPNDDFHSQFEGTHLDRKNGARAGLDHMSKMDRGDRARFRIQRMRDTVAKNAAGCWAW
jgi:hypothetical protein